jgi:hypothetical protein
MSSESIKVDLPRRSKPYRAVTEAQICDAMMKMTIRTDARGDVVEASVELLGHE